MAFGQDLANFKFLRECTGYKVDGSAVMFEFGEARLLVKVLRPGVVRVRMALDGNFAPERSWMPNKPDEEYPPVAIEVKDIYDRIHIRTGEIKILLHKPYGRLTFSDNRDWVIVTDAISGGSGTGADGSVISTFAMSESQFFYGFGERSGQLNKLHKRYTAWTTDPWYFNGDHGPGADQLYQAIPFYIGLYQDHGAYGIYLNNSYQSAIDVGKTTPNVVRIEARSGELDYYFFNGAEPAKVVEHYTELTGRMPLPPRWSLGYHQCRWSYYPEQVVRDLAQGFRKRNIPAEVIFLDIDWMEGYRVFTWSDKRFPDPKKLCEDLAAQGFKLVVISEPGIKIDENFGVYREGLEKDYFIKNPDGSVAVGYVWPGASHFPDYTRQEVRDWWAGLHKSLVVAGVAGIWNDMNEIAAHTAPFGSGEGVPYTPDLASLQGDAGERTTHAEVHNVYANLQNQATFEGLLQAEPEKRPFILTRAGFAGVQKHAAVWTGDNWSVWEHLEMSMPELANLGLSGVAFVGSDIGGFNGTTSREMFARWIQLGAFYPFARGHAMAGMPDKEPWMFGTEVEAISRKYIELRYQLLPYLYTAFYGASQTGAPIFRPLVYAFWQDPAVATLYDQVLIGDAIMLAPIYRSATDHRLVYLPEGVWYDFWTKERLEGKQYIIAKAPLDIMPMYIRGGSVVPFAPVMQYSDEKPLDSLTLEVYPDAGGAASGKLYEDDGISFAYRQGVYRLTEFSFRLEGAEVIPSVSVDNNGTYVPHPRTVKARVFIPQGVKEIEINA
jgi:alpha-glucosidase